MTQQLNVHYTEHSHYSSYVTIRNHVKTTKTQIPLQQPTLGKTENTNIHISCCVFVFVFYITLQWRKRTRGGEQCKNGTDAYYVYCCNEFTCQVQYPDLFTSQYLETDTRSSCHFQGLRTTHQKNERASILCIHISDSD